MTDQRFSDVAVALDDCLVAIGAASDALAVLKACLRHDAYWLPQQLRDAEAALIDARKALVDIEPADDEFSDEDE